LAGFQHAVLVSKTSPEASGRNTYPTAKITSNPKPAK